jgi:hypothetical protein
VDDVKNLTSKLAVLGTVSLPLGYALMLAADNGLVVNQQYVTETVADLVVPSGCLDCGSRAGVAEHV